MVDNRYSPAPQIVRGQYVAPAQLNRAKRLRREMTKAERCLWKSLRAARLAGWHFRRQQPIGAYYVDFYCHAAGVVVEVDGGIHAKQRAYDAIRDDILSSYGLSVLHFSNEDIIENLMEVLTRIAQVCDSRTERNSADNTGPRT